MRIKRLKPIPKSLRGKRVLVRVDFNEPLKKGVIEDSFRIQKTKPLLYDLRKQGAQIILCAHIEDSVTKKQLSFRPLIGQFERLLGFKITFEESYEVSNIHSALEKTGVVLLENVRFHKGEESNDKKFAKLLASYADIYVNEAFSVSHRAHASVVGVTRYIPSYAGPLLCREVEALSTALRPPHPFLLIVGGVKFQTKFALLKSFLPLADAVFVGGALANTFLKAHGVDVGSSVYEKTAISQIKKNLFLSKKIFFPIDVRTSLTRSRAIGELKKHEGMFDIGPETVEGLKELARLTRLIVWNGPLGYTEKGYTESTIALLRAFAKMKHTKVILGGGDTLSVLDETNLGDKFYHVSTGGGAMLDYLADGSLPGVDALLYRKK